MKEFRIAIFASGSGTNAAKIIDHFRGHQQIEVALVLSNNPQALVLERARERQIKGEAFSRDEFRAGEHLLANLQKHKITHIVLAGFLWLIPEYLIEHYPDKIINIHPALLPKFGGKGMYGSKVHDAVLSAKETATGITIHLVNRHYDEGKVIFQSSCDISQCKTSQEIAACVQQLEHHHYPRVIENWISGKDQSII